jgi:4-hydroxyphenylpyruvate dioxygenase
MSDPNAKNPTGLLGIDFVELASPDPGALHRLLVAFGFSRTMKHARARDRPVPAERHHVPPQPRGPTASRRAFTAAHGPSHQRDGLALRATQAAAVATQRAPACAHRPTAICAATDRPERAGGVRHRRDALCTSSTATEPVALGFARGFVAHPSPVKVADKGFLTIDHLTNNVAKGELPKWAGFYKDVFGFTEVRYFDIRGVQTGPDLLRAALARRLASASRSTRAPRPRARSTSTSRSTRARASSTWRSSPPTSWLAPRARGQRHRDPRHRRRLLPSVFDRVPGVREDKAEIARRQVLVDGDAEGYLLQIFTKNLIGPIFVEIIQRENHLSFGEGNFGALFRSIERDQQKRGYLDDARP